jgi:hypothetical protein
MTEPGELIRPSRNRGFERRTGGELRAKAQDLHASQSGIGQLDAIAEVVEKAWDDGC